MTYKCEFKFSYSDMESKQRLFLGDAEIDLDDSATLLNAKDERIAELEKERDEYHAMVVYMGAIMDESEGVAGYHLNGDVAKWDDLFTESLYKDAASVRDLEQQAKGIEDALSKWTLGDSRNIYDYLKDRAKALKDGN